MGKSVSRAILVKDGKVHRSQVAIIVSAYKKYRSMATSSPLYHRTEEDRAIKILKENKIRMSTWLGTGSDKASGKDQMWFFSTSTRPDAYRTDSSGVVFVLDGNKLRQNYETSPFDYWQKTGRNQEESDEAEERVFSDSPVMTNASQFVTELHAHWWMSDDTSVAAHAYKRHRELALLAKQHHIPLFWYSDLKKMSVLDKSAAKSFSDFPKSQSLTHNDLTERRSGASEYFIKRWTSLLSLQPAKTMADVPNDIRKYLSGYSDGHLSFQADIHNATKNMSDDKMRYVYKLQTQMKLAGTSAFKEFYWKMMDKLGQLEKASGRSR